MLRREKMNPVFSNFVIYSWIHQEWSGGISDTLDNFAATCVFPHDWLMCISPPYPHSLHLLPSLTFVSYTSFCNPLLWLALGEFYEKIDLPFSHQELWLSLVLHLSYSNHLSLSRLSLLIISSHPTTIHLYFMKYSLLTLYTSPDRLCWFQSWGTIAKNSLPPNLQTNPKYACWDFF